MRSLRSLDHVVFDVKCFLSEYPSEGSTMMMSVKEFSKAEKSLMPKFLCSHDAELMNVGLNNGSWVFCCTVCKKWFYIPDFALTMQQVKTGLELARVLLDSKRSKNKFRS